MSCNIKNKISLKCPLVDGPASYSSKEIKVVFPIWVALTETLISHTARRSEQLVILRYWITISCTLSDTSLESGVIYHSLIFCTVYEGQCVMRRLKKMVIFNSEYLTGFRTLGSVTGILWNFSDCFTPGGWEAHHLLLWPRGFYNRNYWFSGTAIVGE